MSYQIKYAQEMSYRYPQARNKQRVNPGKWLCIVGVIAAVLWMRLNGIPDFLVPGDPEITKTAAVALIGDIREGVSMNQAVTAFCETIIHGAGS